MDAGLDFRFAPVPILGLNKVALRAVVVDETTGLPADTSLQTPSGTLGASRCDAHSKVRERLFSFWYPAFRSWLPFQIGLWPSIPRL
jgi:hypothetical protein